MSATAEEYRINLPETEDLEHPEEELQDVVQERLAEWDEAIDAVIAQANDQLARAKKSQYFDPKVWGEEFAAAENAAIDAREAELQEHYTENKLQQRYYEGSQADVSLVIGYTRERRDYDTRHSANMLQFALRAADHVEFGSLEERRSFAAVAAERMLEELVTAPYDPSPEWNQVYEIAAERLEASLSSWSPDDSSADRRPDLVMKDAVNALNHHRRNEGCKPDFYLWVSEDFRQANPPGRDLTGFAEHFTAENYQNPEILGAAGQELIDNLLAVLQERWPDTVGYPDMNDRQYEREFNLDVDDDNDQYIGQQRLDTLELLFTDMRTVFRRQEFASRDDFLIQSGEVARAATAYLGIPEDSPGYQMAEILQDRLSCFLTETQLETYDPSRPGGRNPFQHAAELRDLAEAAALYAEHSPEKELDYALLIEQGASSRAYMRGSNEYLPPELLRMHAANTFEEGLEAYGLSPRDLHFPAASFFALELQIDPYEYPFPRPDRVSESYANLLRHAIVQNHETLRGGIEAANLLDPNPDAEMQAWREEIGYDPAREKDPERLNSAEWQQSCAAEWQRQQTEQRQLSAAMAAQANSGDADHFLVYQNLNPTVGKAIFGHLSAEGKKLQHPLLQEEFNDLTAQVRYQTREDNAARFAQCGPLLTAMGAILNLETHWQRIRQAEAAAA